MSEHDDAAWQEYMDNYNRAFNCDNTVNSNGNNPVNPMTDPFNSGDRVTENNRCQRSPDVEFLSTLFPLATSTNHSDNGLEYDMTSFSHCPPNFLQNNNNCDDAFSVDETHVIARLQRLMDSRLENVQPSSNSVMNDRFRGTNSHGSIRRVTNSNEPHSRSLPINCTDSNNFNSFDVTQSSPELVVNSAYNLSTADINLERIQVDSGSEDDSLDQYLESYRQSSQQQEGQPSESPMGQFNCNSSHSSTFNLDDEWRKLSQPRNNVQLSDFMQDLSFTPFSFMGSTPYQNSMRPPSGQNLRTNLTRLNSGLSRCEQKAETVQQMLENLQGTLRSNNAISISNFTNRCYELTQRLDATLEQQQNNSVYTLNELASSSSSTDDDRPLTYIIDPEYAEWDAETTMSNEAYLNFAFEYDSSDELASRMNNSEGPISYHRNMAVGTQDISSHNLTNQRTTPPPSLGRRVRDMSPATREFHISIGYPVNDEASESSCVMVPDNPRSFPRNLLGDETPLPLFDGLQNEQENQDDLSVPPNIPDSGVGSDSDQSSQEFEHNDSGIEMEENMANQSTNPITENVEITGNCGDTTQLQSRFNLMDIENMSDTLWEQGVKFPPAIDYSDVEGDLENMPKSSKCANFSDENVARIQKMVTEELEKDCSLTCEDKCQDSWDGEDCDGDEDGEKILDESQYSDAEKSDDVNEVDEVDQDEIDHDFVIVSTPHDCGDIKSQISQKDVSEDRSSITGTGSSQEDEDEEDASVGSKSCQESEVESGAGGDTTFNLGSSPSKISGFKAGLKKMCSCFANPRKHGLNPETFTPSINTDNQSNE